MKGKNLFKLGILVGLFAFTGCQEDTLVAEVPSLEGGVATLAATFVSKDDVHSNVHRWTGKNLQFELLQGKNRDEDLSASFDNSKETLEALVGQFAKLKGIDEYKLLAAECYELPEKVQLRKGQSSISFEVKIKDVADGIYVLPLVLKNGTRELGVQFVEVVQWPDVTDIDRTWLSRTPSVTEPRLAVAIEAAENDLRNAGNYILYPEGVEKPALKRPLFDMVVIFSANMNFDEGTGTPVLYYNESVRKVLANRDVFVKPLQDKGIKVLLSVMPNHQGIGFSNLDISGEREMIRGFARDIRDAIQMYGLDGVMFDDEYADYPGNKESEQVGRPMIQMGSFHFLVKELRNQMPFVEGQEWKDRHNLITFYNVGPFSNAAVGEKKWGLFSNHFDFIKEGTKGWEDSKVTGDDQKSLRDWVRNLVNQDVLDEIGQIKVGELFDFVWNANYKRGDNYNYSMNGGTLAEGTWIAGMDKAIAVEKYGLASFEMSLELGEYRNIRHKTEYWEVADWGSGTPGRLENRTQTINKQKKEGQKTMLLFNLQYVPDAWGESPFTNLYLADFPVFMKELGNVKNPAVKFEGKNYDTVRSSYLK